jgi:hypothetical protein
MTKWHRGPPPSIGWWPASVRKNVGIFRWWNGRIWSSPTGADFTTAEALAQALHPSKDNRDVLWRARPSDWPARSLT